MFRATLAGCLLLLSLTSPAAFAAGTATQSFRAAADAVEDAYDKTSRGSESCAQSIGRALDTIVDRIDDFRRKSASDSSISGTKLELSRLAMAVPASGCPLEASDDLQRAVDALEEARTALWASSSSKGRPDDRRSRRRGDEARMSDTSSFAQLSSLQVQTNARFENDNAVRISMPELKLFNLEGRAFYIGARFRSLEGHWSEWVTTQVWSVPNGNFVWKNAFNHFLRYSALAEEDFSGGRFIAQVAVFDQSANRQLAFREAGFRVRLPQLPNGPPVGLPSAPAPMHDCGASDDIGCMMTREGQYPMDAQVFGGIIQALRSQLNEMMRLQTIQGLLAAHFLTAQQLSPMLDMFRNETLRLKVAELASHRIVNPQHAIGFSAKFRNPQMAQAYTEFMTQQPGGGLPGQQASPVVVQVPAPGYPMPVPGAYRDCGTGNDPGCTATRNGRRAMEAQAFIGMMAALQSADNELVRADMARSIITANAVTAAQFGLVLDLFKNDLTRLDLAKGTAKYVVDPQHALGLAAKYQNSLLGQEFTLLMTSQR